MASQTFKVEFSSKAVRTATEGSSQRLPETSRPTSHQTAMQARKVHT